MSKQRSVTLIYNPQAGPANRLAMLQRVAELWKQRGWVAHLRPTRCAGDAEILAREAASIGQDVVLAAGGDGTLSEAANGLAGTDTILAALPTGTGNSLAKELKTPLPNLYQSEGLLYSAETLLNGKVQTIDLMQSHQGRFGLLWLGAGAESFVVDYMEPRSKRRKRLGSPGYLAESLMILPRLPRWRTSVRINGDQYDGQFSMVVVSNCKYYAGGELELFPNAAWDDSKLSVLLYKGKSIASLFALMLQARLKKHLDNRNVVQVSAETVQIATTPKMPIHIDGDPQGYTPAEVTIRPKALRLLTPDTTPCDRFLQPGIPLHDAI